MHDTVPLIRTILDDLQTAVTARDLDALLDLLDDETVVLGTSSQNLDRDACAAYLTGLLGLPVSPRWSWDTVVPLVEQADLLAFAVVGTLGLDDAEGRPTTVPETFRLSVVAVRRGGRWRLRHFHGSVPAPD